jgi:uncharacterized cupredoxin-like copper-binding protein
MIKQQGFNKMSRFIRIAFLLLSLTFLAACGSSPEPAEPQTIRLEATEFAFTAPTITVRANQPVTLHFTNQGQIDHELAADEWGVQTELLRPGQSTTVTFTPKETGAFSFYCTIPGHTAAGMTGTITVSS